jgi:hypothetical protein
MLVCWSQLVQIDKVDKLSVMSALIWFPPTWTNKVALFWTISLVVFVTAIMLYICVQRGIDVLKREDTK